MAINQEPSQSSRNTELYASVVAAVQAYLEGAWKRKPVDYDKQTFYGEWDLWFFLAISDEVTCWTCEILNNHVIRGIELRMLFPWHIIGTPDLIIPLVHPNCRCALLRITDINDYFDLETPIRVQPEETLAAALRALSEGSSATECHCAACSG